jgi:hypothetical protein
MFDDSIKIQEICGRNLELCVPKSELEKTVKGILLN